ncbi:rab GTPase [Salpingoeca rosetta]|uniref:Ras-related protein Rab n=1 Tax=Salpingoeca rosetta (strain ATCC 50818 / BSB-021) TaxID=946362 RepID=F2UQ58_SALR5|nr:rab GTPase [Salpingoeca rosetta]EGD79726.1 rab GTPase [Salpingoeca rosetta]|eukprot:XP_004988675.1 rab GTPase [Salpingoeca rosetta]
MADEDMRELLYKVLVVGDSGVGKTSLIKRYVHGVASDKYKATIGVDFALKVLQVNENTTVRLQLWDIAGQERFGSMTRVYYKEAVGAFVVFDVTRLDTFKAVKTWKEDIDAKVFLPDGSKIPVVLMANKCDLAVEGFRTQEEMQEYCANMGFVSWFETSAKLNKNIEEAVNCLVQNILEKEPDSPHSDGDVLDIKDTNPKDREKTDGGCC